MNRVFCSFNELGINKNHPNTAENKNMVYTCYTTHFTSGPPPSQPKDLLITMRQAYLSIKKGATQHVKRCEDEIPFQSGCQGHFAMADRPMEMFI